MSLDRHPSTPDQSDDETRSSDGPPAASSDGSLAVSVDDGRVTVRIDGDSRAGRVVDLREHAACPSATALATRLPRAAAWRDRPEFDADRSFTTVTPQSPPPCRLAAIAARSRGATTPVDDELAAVNSRSDSPDATESSDLTTDLPDLAAARERVAETGSEVEQLRERVAMLRGRLQAARETDGEPSEVQTELDTAMRALTEAETAELAARQQLDRARQHARARRDSHERRLRRHDARQNRAREARTHLAAAVADRLAAATEQIAAATDRGRATFDHDTGTVSGDPVTFHLATLAVAETTEPAVVAVEGLGDPTALRRLGVPVIVAPPP